MTYFNLQDLTPYPGQRQNWECFFPLWSLLCFISLVLTSASSVHPSELASNFANSLLFVSSTAWEAIDNMLWPVLSHIPPPKIHNLSHCRPVHSPESRSVSIDSRRKTSLVELPVRSQGQMLACLFIHGALLAAQRLARRCRRCSNELRWVNTISKRRHCWLVHSLNHHGQFFTLKPHGK